MFKIKVWHLVAAFFIGHLTGTLDSALFVATYVWKLIGK